MLVSKTPAVKFAVAYVFVDPSKSATLACVYRHQEFHFPVCTGLPEDWIGVKTYSPLPKYFPLSPNFLSGLRISILR